MKLSIFYCWDNWEFCESLALGRLFVRLFVRLFLRLFMWLFVWLLLNTLLKLVFLTPVKNDPSKTDKLFVFVNLKYIPLTQPTYQSSGWCYALTFPGKDNFAYCFWRYHSCIKFYCYYSCGSCLLGLCLLWMCCRLACWLSLSWLGEQGFKRSCSIVFVIGMIAGGWVYFSCYVYSSRLGSCFCDCQHCVHWYLRFPNSVAHYYWAWAHLYYCLK